MHIYMYLFMVLSIGFSIGMAVASLIGRNRLWWAMLLIPVPLTIYAIAVWVTVGVRL